MGVEIKALEKQLYELTMRLNELRTRSAGVTVPNYTFATLAGEVTLPEF